MATILNMTPHTINLVHADGTNTPFFPTGAVARASQRTEELGELDGCRLIGVTYGEPEDLPDPTPGTYYIVSSLTATAAKAAGRTTDDLLLTADAVRDDTGRIVGCRAFAKV